MRGHVDTGERSLGDDYWQDMVLWSMPDGVQSEDFSGPIGPGGLVC